MYGLVNHVIEQLVKQNFNQETWDKITEMAGVRQFSKFAMFSRYDDDVTYSLVFAAEKVLKIPAESILELFGQFFYAFCVEAGYSNILRSLAATPVEFLENLDALHDHLGSTYAGMRAPSFRCTRDENDDDDTSRVFLHYYSHRPGLAPIVAGILKAAIADIFHLRVVLLAQPDHNDGYRGVCFEVKVDSADNATEETTMSGNNRLGSTVSLNSGFPRPRLSPATFAELFPYHIIFNRRLHVVQVGRIIAKVCPLLSRPNPIALDMVFDIERPRVPFQVQDMLAHLNTVYVLSERSPPSNRQSLRLKGQMSLLVDGSLLYLASPSVTSLEQMASCGLNLSDIPIGDATRNVLIMSERFRAEYELSSQLENLTHALQETYRDIDLEKQKTDSLIFAAFPPSVALEMKKDGRVIARSYKNVTLLMSGFRGFQRFCETNDPVKVVQLLNECFTSFDHVLNGQTIGQKVYKVETIMDHYFWSVGPSVSHVSPHCFMVFSSDSISGCPEATPDHARTISLTAVELMKAATEAHLHEKNLILTIGIHSGEIVAGVIGERMPRYCIFGDTVNTVSRTESFGKAGGINVTDFSYRIMLKQGVASEGTSFEFLGEVLMKGKSKPVALWQLLTTSRTTKGAPPHKDVAFSYGPRFNLSAPFSHGNAKLASKDSVGNGRRSRCPKSTICALL